MGPPLFDAKFDAVSVSPGIRPLNPQEVVNILSNTDDASWKFRLAGDVFHSRRKRLLGCLISSGHASSVSKLLVCRVGKGV